MSYSRNNKLSKKLITATSSIAVALASVLTFPLAAHAADYVIDCTNGPSGSGLTLSDFEETAPDYFVADLYFGGTAAVTKTVTVVNCTFALARNAYPNSWVSASGGEFIYGVSTDYTITIPVGALGDVWGQKRWVTPATSYIINFFNSVDPNAPGPEISTSVAVSLSPGQWLNSGDAVGITAEVTASSGTIDPSGTIAWSYCYDASSIPSCDFSNDTPLTGHLADALTGGTADGKSSASIPSLSLPNSSGYYVFLAEYSGDSTFSGEWNSANLTLSPVAPGAPGTPTGTSGDGEVELSWSAPSTGSSPFTYSITSSPAGAECSITGTTASCTGLTNGTAYTFKVTATNAAGSEDSSYSSSVTPQASAPGGGSSSVKAKYKPVKPSESEVEVRKGNGLLQVFANYAGTNSYKPSSYTVKVSPGGNSCVIYGANSSCEVIGLKNGIEYSVSISASNKFGTSPSTTLGYRYLLTEAGLLGFASKRTIPDFAGGSAKLTKSFKAEIKKFLDKNGGVTAITCTGYTAGKPVIKSDKVLAKTRAANVCAYIEKIKPSVSTTTIGKTPGLPWGPANRKVVIRGYSAIG